MRSAKISRFKALKSNFGAVNMGTGYVVYDVGSNGLDYTG
jgi:hypothetical protein